MSVVNISLNMYCISYGYVTWLAVTPQVYDHTVYDTTLHWYLYLAYVINKQMLLYV